MVELQSTWTWLPAIYLFLGGMGAGAFVTVSVLRFVRPGRYQKVVTAGTWIAVVALAIGLLSLVAEVEKPFQAMLLPMSFVNPTSWMTVGAWLLLVTFVVVGLSAVFSTPKVTGALKMKEKTLGTLNKVLAGLGIPLATCVAVYTGILLNAAPAIPLWGTWLLPVLFTVSAFDTGVAAVALALAFDKSEAEAAWLRGMLEKATIVLVVLEVAVLAAFVLTMQGAGADEARAVGTLVSGALSVPFWALVAVVGLAGPLAAALVSVAGGKKLEDGAVGRVVPVVGAACALVGGFTLRYVILVAGVHAAIASPDALQAAMGVLML